MEEVYYFVSIVVLVLFSLWAVRYVRKDNKKVDLSLSLRDEAMRLLIQKLKQEE